MKLIHILLLCIPVNVLAQSTKGNNSLPITLDLSNVRYSEKPQKLSEFAESISYIRLSEEPLLPDVFLTQLTIDEHFIYVGLPVRKYTLSGKFVKQLFRLGQGPKEVVRAFSHAVYNLPMQYALIMDSGGNRCKRFSLKGTFLGTEGLQDSTAYYKDIIGYIGNNQIFVYTKQPYIPKVGEKGNMDGPVMWYVKDTTTNRIVYQKPNTFYNIKVKRNSRNMMGKKAYPLNFGQIGSELWMRHVNQDTIYHTKDGLLYQPWYIIKKSSHCMNYATLMALQFGDISVTGHDVPNVFALPNGVIFDYYTGLTEKSKYGKGFCPANGKALTFSDKPFENDLDTYLPSLQIKDMTNNLYVRDEYLYVLINAQDFFENDGKAPFPDMTEESNPVIVKLKLKNYDTK